MSYSGTGAAPEVVEFKVGSRGFRATLDSVLKARGSLSPASKTAVAFQMVADKPGPWFPCSPYGCCRAFD